MKLSLDQVRPKVPKPFWVCLTTLIFLIMFWQMPVNWVGGILASQTGCRVLLQEPSGTIWQGSAALGFSELNASQGVCREPFALTERFHWSSHCSLSTLSCTTEIQFGALEKPQVIQWGLKKTQITANEIKLPANVLEGLGNPWSTLRPRGQLAAHWTDIALGGLVAVGDGTKNARSGVIGIIISNLSSPINPIKPLGSYEILANLGDDGLNWSLSTTSGPLLLRGDGTTKLGVHFEGIASALPEAQDSLIGLLSLLGKKEGDGYRLQF